MNAFNYDISEKVNSMSRCSLVAETWLKTHHRMTHVHDRNITPGYKVKLYTDVTIKLNYPTLSLSV